MDKKVRNLNVEEILFFDIETVSRNKELKVDSKEYELYSWSIRDKQTGFVPPAIEVKKHYKKMAALKPEFNKVVVVSVGYIKDKVLYYKALTGTQKEIVEQFYSMVQNTGFKVCGHNIIGFDLPVVRIKSFEEGIDPANIPDSIMDSNKKPWDLEKFVYDTMKIITGTYFYNVSLDAACMLKGIKSSKEDISGPQVSEAYYNGELDRVAEYCNKDVIATAELFLALQGKKDYLEGYVDKTNQEVEKRIVNVLKHITASGQLTSKVINSIVKFAEEENLSKENTLTIVRTALSKSKEYLKVEEDDLLELKEALGLLIDYSKIQCVADKGNLGKKEADILVKQYKEASKEEKLEVLELTEKFLIENKKTGQKRAQAALEFLKKELK